MDECDNNCNDDCNDDYSDSCSSVSAGEISVISDLELELDSVRDAADEDLNGEADENEEEQNSTDVIVREEQLESNVTVPQTSTVPRSIIPCHGYTITSDNIDKNFRASFQRMDKGTESVHYLHSFAAQDRIDISKYSDEPQAAIVSPESVLSSKSDLCEILKEFEILISRYVCIHTFSVYFILDYLSIGLLFNKCHNINIKRIL